MQKEKKKSNKFWQQYCYVEKVYVKVHDELHEVKGKHCQYSNKWYSTTIKHSVQALAKIVVCRFRKSTCELHETRDTSTDTVLSIQ